MSKQKYINPADIHLSAEEQRAFNHFAAVDQAILQANERPHLTNKGLVDPFPDAEYGQEAFLMHLTPLGKELRSLQREQQHRRTEDFERWEQNKRIALSSRNAAVASAIAAGCSALVALASFLYMIIR